MKKVILSTLFLVIALISFSQVYVRGYYKKNGTYVEPHYRSNPDGIVENNWSYPGNVNPYTGRIGGTNQYVGSENSTIPSSYTPSSYSSSHTPTYDNSNSSSYRTFYPSIYTSGSYSNSNSYKSSSNSLSNNSNRSGSSKNFKVSSTVIVTADVLNVRSYASTSGSVKYKLSLGEKVVVIDNYTDGWLRVKYVYFDTDSNKFKYDYGYVSTKYIMYWSE